MATPDIVISDRPDPADREAILQALLDYNTARAGAADIQPFAALLRDPGTGNTIGGLWGRSAYGWFFVELLVVPEHLRGQGVGTALMRSAEDAARKRGCVGIWLDTFSFQAPGFYRKLGFETFGRLDYYPGQSSRYFLAKRFEARTS